MNIAYLNVEGAWKGIISTKAFENYLKILPFCNIEKRKVELLFKFKYLGNFRCEYYHLSVVRTRRRFD